MLMHECNRCEILAGEDTSDILAALLAVRVPSGWEEQALPAGKVRFIVHAPDFPDPSSAPLFLRALRDDLLAALPALDIRLTYVKNEDWQRCWREFFLPVPCGEHFLVLPPWLEHAAHEGTRRPIIIEPRSAFGTGHHASTALCLTALSALFDAGHVRPGMEFLDIGTGSGILGIACCRLGLYGLGLDTDPLAVENALENKARNGCADFTVETGSVERAAGRRFDLVLANILADPLKDMAPDIVRLMKSGACLVLSGILAVQSDAVEAAYTAQGLCRAERRQEEEWTALVWPGSSFA